MTSIVSKNGLQLLQLYLGFDPADTNSKDIEDAVFIAIDVENTNTFSTGRSQNPKSQVGVAIFDTRDLASSKQPTISTHNSVTGSPSYCNRCTKRFIFGETIIIRQEDSCQSLESLISRNRNNVLVGHDVTNELKVLEFLQFDLHSSFKAILDTQRIAAEIRPRARTRLCDILRAIQCPYNRLHVAGNDAHFTLRALLLFATNHHRDDDAPNSEIHAKLTALESILRAAVPKVSNPKTKKKEKMQIRERRKRKNPARLRSAETIAQIRSERTERRLQSESDWEEDAAAFTELMRALQNLEIERFPRRGAATIAPEDAERAERNLKEESDSEFEISDVVAWLIPT